MTHDHTGPEARAESPNKLANRKVGECCRVERVASFAKALSFLPGTTWLLQVRCTGSTPPSLAAAVASIGSLVART